MGLDRDLQKSLEALYRKDAVIFPAKVVSVDTASATATVKDADEFEYDDVRLKANIDNNDNALLIVPKIGSSVLVAQIGDDIDNLFVIAVSEVDTVKGKIETTDFEIDETGYKIEKNGENLARVLSDMIDEINKIVVVQGNTINVAAMNVIKQRLNSILK